MNFRVLLVDDSALVRAAVKEILGKIENLEVCGEARQGEEAIRRIIIDRPDLVIMDVEMPVMDGLSTLREIKERGLPVEVLMLSVLTQRGADITFQALELGALDFVPKPSPDSGLTLFDVEHILITKISELIQTRREHRLPTRIRKETPLKKGLVEYQALVIGSSTGGPRALQQIFEHLSGNFQVPIVIIQHMPPVFSNAFARRLDTLSPLKIKEAEDGDLLKRGHVYIAPGDQHLLIEQKGNPPVIRLNHERRVNGHRPSIDVTLFNFIKVFKSRMAALIMTGMGKDGADGMKLLHDEGGLTLAQDEQSSVVFGMNRRAIELGGIDRVLPLEKIAPSLEEYLKGAP